MTHQGLAWVLSKDFLAKSEGARRQGSETHTHTRTHALVRNILKAFQETDPEARPRNPAAQPTTRALCARLRNRVHKEGEGDRCCPRTVEKTEIWLTWKRAEEECGSLSPPVICDPTDKRKVDSALSEV